MFIRRIHGTFFAVLMPKWLAKAIPWKLIHIIPEIIISCDKLLVSPCFSKDLKKDPFFLATKFIIENNDNQAIKTLTNYYRKKNKKASILSQKYFCSKYKNFNEIIMYSCMPWQNVSRKLLSNRIESVKNSHDMKRKAIEYNLDQTKIGNYQVQAVGILSKESIMVEFERYKYVSKSISDNGYKLHKNFINGFILKNGENEKIVIFDGLHKTMSLLALGKKNIRVCLPLDSKIIELKKLNHIPIIKNKIAKKKTVRNLLKLIYEGDGIF